MLELAGIDPSADVVRAVDYDALVELYQHQCREETKYLKKAAGNVDLAQQIIDKLKVEKADLEKVAATWSEQAATYKAERDALIDENADLKRQIAVLTATQRNAGAVLELKRKHDSYLGALNAILIDRNGKPLVISGEAVLASESHVSIDFTHDRKTGTLTISQGQEDETPPSNIVIARG